MAFSSSFARAVLLLAAAPLAVTAQSASSAAPRAFTPTDWYKLTTVGSPAVSPDGRRVAFTVTTVREAENKRHSEIWMVPAAGGTPVRLTSPGTESSAPRWSADGSILLFTSKREGSKGTTWGLRMDQPGEAVEMADYPQGSVPLDRRFAVWSDSVIPDSTAAEQPSAPKRGRVCWTKPFKSLPKATGTLRPLTA